MGCTRKYTTKWVWARGEAEDNARYLCLVIRILRCLLREGPESADHFRNEFKEAFESFDVLAMPTAPTTAFDIGGKTGDPVQMYLNDIFTIPANIAGIPAISVSCGILDGLPVGLQFMAGALQEKKLFRAAYAYQQATNWHHIKANI